MKAKDLKCPFTWENRRVLQRDGVLYLPEYLSEKGDYVFPGWQSSLIFGNDHPVKVEYCSGNGSWIVAKARQFPEYNWVAVERQFERVRKIWSKTKNLALPNLFILCGEANLATQCYFPASSVSEAFVNFPDPWPKRRHAKHRLLTLAFAQAVSQALRDGGAFTVVTDDPDYSALTIETLTGSGFFRSDFPEPYYVTEWPEYGTSYFEELWRGKGRAIRYHRFTIPKIIQNCTCRLD